MDILPPPVLDFCLTHGYGPIRRAVPLGGGCINNASRLDTDKGPLFLKTNSQAPPDMFEREAEGLAALTVPGGPRLPKVLAVGQDFILQEFIAPGPRRGDGEGNRWGDRKGRPYWETLGLQMAALHNVTSPRFGFTHDNYLGPTPQINDWEEDGYTFFAKQRLRYQAELAHRNGLLDSSDLQSLISLLPHLPSLLPPQPASILHGDLWSGNLHTDTQGGPVLIDPAAYYGWAEADLAMMALFGSPPDSFFRAYESVRPLTPGYRDRFDLYNLYHLLNHLNLFGQSYLGPIRAILRRYN